MSVATYPTLLQISGDRRPMAGWMLILSLILHCALLAVMAGLRFVPKNERPLASYQVSLVSLPQPARTAAVPNPAPIPPVDEPVPQQATTPPASQPAVQLAPATPPPPAAAKPVKMAPRLVAPARKQAVAPGPPVKATAPKAAPVTAALPPRETPPVKRQPDDMLREVLKGIELPPAAPKLGDLAPPAAPTSMRQAQVVKPDPAAQKLSNRIRDLKVPEVPVAMSPAKPAPAQPVPLSSQPVVSEELLQKLQQPVEKIRPLPERSVVEHKEVRLAAARPATPPPAAQAAAPPAKSGAPTTVIRTSGSEADPYWALVQQKINARWVAPPVDLAQRSLQVTLRFKLDRFGKVSEVAITQSSGNDYYDNAAKRAILMADPLPPFPAEITERHLVPQIIFTVGERTG